MNHQSLYRYMLLVALAVFAALVYVSTATASSSRLELPTEVREYSANPSDSAPYRACPPATATQATCLAVVYPARVSGLGDRGGEEAVPADEEAGHGEEELEPAACECGSGLENGFSPQDLQSAYRLPVSSGGAGQTVAVVDAFDNPHAEEDLAVYREAYGLPPCTEANGCFTKVDQRGGTEYPAPNSSWALEISLDLDMVSAACPKCHILLVEADNNLVSNLGIAVEKAVELGATQISNSYGAREISMGQAAVETYGAAYDQPGVAITVSSGDAGYNNENPEQNEGGKCTNCSPSFPAGLSSVIAVGGTNLFAEGASGRGWKESVWSLSGSGCTLYATKPSWQKDPGCAKRTDNDVAAAGGGGTRVSVYDTFGSFHGWVNVAGTSVSAPIVAGAIALESSTLQAEGIEGIYKHPENWLDVAEGSNWFGLDKSHTFEECSKALLCTAAKGYDGPTGMGSPNGGASTTPPSAVTLPAREVTTSKATIRGVINPEASATTYRFQYGETTAYGNEVPKGGGSVSGYTAPSTKTAEITGLEPSTRYHYRVVAESAGGTTYSGDRVFSTASKTHELNFGTLGEAGQTLKQPEDAVVDASGNVWVADTGNDRIAEFSPDGAFLKSCGHTGSGTPAQLGTDIQFHEPAGIAINPDSGWLYVTDRGNSRIQVLQSSGCQFWAAFGSSGSGSGQLSEPSGILFGRPTGFLVSEGPGELLVADTGNNRIQIFKPSINNKTGVFLGSFGSKGTGNGQFDHPTDIAPDLDHAGEYFVVDSNNGRVQKIKSTGEEEKVFVKYISQFGSKGSGAGQLSTPTAIASDPTTGGLVITDTGNNRVEEFLPGGTYVGAFGSAGGTAEQFQSPKGIAIDADGTAYIADKGNGRVDAWSAATNVKWRITSTPNPGEAINSPLWGVSCTVSSACTAVGEWSPNGGTTGSTLAQRWNGTGWALQTTPNPAGAVKAGLYGSSCASLSSCKAVGWYQNGSGVYFALIESWNGGSWAIQTAPEPVGTLNSLLRGVSCASRAFCMAVGYYENSSGVVVSFAEHWNGKEWKAETTPNPSGAKETLPTAVSCTASTACTMSGFYENSSGVMLPFAERWNGTEWSVQSMPAPAESTKTELRGVSCTSSTACTTVGTYRKGSGAEVGFAERWNGTEWSVQATAVPSGSKNYYLNSVSCVSSTSCTAAGVNLTTASKYTTLVERWDGAEWAVQPTPNGEGGQGWLSGGVSCRSSGFCVAVGNNAKSLAEVRWDGVSTSENPPPSVITEAAASVTPMGATLNGTVNPEGTATNYHFEYGPTAAYGTTTPNTSAGSGTSDIKGSKALEGLQPGSTYHYRIVATNAVGTTYGEDETFITPTPKWTLQTTPNPSTNVSLEDVSCAAASECIAAGAKSGSAYAQRWNGSEWSSMTFTGGSSLTDISCVSSSFCLALPASGLKTQRWNGSAWAIVAAASPGASPVFRGVSCTSSTFCIAVGGYQPSAGVSRILTETWNGSTWTVVTSPFEEGGLNELNAVSCTSSTSCTAIGTKGGKPIALRWGGSAWSSLTAPKEASASSADISCAAANACTAVLGGSAKVERWNGEEWSAATAPTPEGGSAVSLFGISCASAMSCVAIGSYTNAGKAVTLGEGWNGSAWSVQSTPNLEGGGVLRGLSCTSPINCTAAGYYQPKAGESKTVAERYQ